MIAKCLIIYIIVVLIGLMGRIIYVRRRFSNDSKNRK